MFKRIVLALTAAVLALAGAFSGSGKPGSTDAAAISPQTIDAASCSGLTGLSLADTTIDAAVLVPAAGALPEHCLVRGHVEAEINFEVKLPTTAWNGKLYFAGGGGFNGFIPPATAGLVRGYATIGTDTGHVGTSLFDGTWALGHPDRLENFAYRAVHVVTVAAKQIVAGAYGNGPQYAYLEGWSEGGRQGMVSAQRYPDDFDGIVSGAPVLDITGQGLFVNRAQQARMASPGLEDKLAVLGRSVVAECDAKDGLVDGLIESPGRCRFDPATLICAGGDAPDCLTAAQVETARKIYAGPVTPAGEPLYPGAAPGAESFLAGWELWLSGPGPFGFPLGMLIGDGSFRFIFFGDLTYDTFAFDFDDDLAQVEALSPLLDAADPDLSAFRDAGGKLLVWHGLADVGVNVDRTIAYWNEVEQAMHGPGKVDDFFRLFLAPGLGHCYPSGTLGLLETCGPGLNTFDALSALENWVEHGIVPDSIAASHVGPGVARTRPLCAYPKIAVYSGQEIRTTLRISPASSAALVGRLAGSSTSLPPDGGERRRKATQPSAFAIPVTEIQYESDPSVLILGSRSRR